jgi:hypothetical protein
VVHETSVHETSRDLNSKQSRDDHPRQRSNRASRECLARAQAKVSKRAAQAYQANRDTRRADEARCVEDKGQWRLAIWRDEPEPWLEAARRGKEERFERICGSDYDRNDDHIGMGLSNSSKKCGKRE